MEIVNNKNLIENEQRLNDKSALPLKQNNQSPGSIITTLMSTHLVKKPQNESLFKSERPDNDNDIESIETKLSELKNINDVFYRENIISNRDFNINVPEKKIEDEINILKKDKLEKEKRKEEYEKELRTDMEIHKKNMENDEEKINNYYKSRRRKRSGNAANNFLLVALLIVIVSLLILLIFLLTK